MRRSTLPGIVVATLIVFGGLPIAGSACAMLCEPALHARGPAAKAAAHHGEAACHAEGSAPSPTIGRAGHDCGTHVATRPNAATLVTARPDMSGPVACQQRASATLVAARPAPAFLDSPPHGPPLAPSGATIAPLILRV